MRKLLIVILLLLLATGFASGQAVTAKSPQLPQAKWVGVLEDGGVQPTLPAAKAKMKLVSNAGLGWVKESVRWIPGQTTFSAEDLNGLRNSVEAAVSEGLKVCLALWPFTSRQKHYSPPTTDAEQKRFSVFAANVANEFPQVHCFFIWNEPNNPFFWRPQFAADGTDVAAIAYERLLARSYDVLKVISPDNLVIGGETASNGADNFWAKRKSQSPVTFIMDIGEAYRQSGRTRPIMDAYGHHPYGLNSAESPFKKHQNLTTIGVSDYPRLVQTLGQAFDGTAQRGSNLPIVYGEYGVQTRIPASQQPGYRLTMSLVLHALLMKPRRPSTTPSTSNWLVVSQMS